MNKCIFTVFNKNYVFSSAIFTISLNFPFICVSVFSFRGTFDFTTLDYRIIKITVPVAMESVYSDLHGMPRDHIGGREIAEDKQARKAERFMVLWFVAEMSGSGLKLRYYRSISGSIVMEFILLFTDFIKHRYKSSFPF
jgi:hypothetical protein